MLCALTRVTCGSGGLMGCFQSWDPACYKPARWGCSCPTHSFPPCLGVLEVRRRTWGFSGLLTPGGGQGRWRQDMHTNQPRKSLPRTASSADSNQANSCHPPDASRVLVSQSLPPPHPHSREETAWVLWKCVSAWDRRQ